MGWNFINQTTRMGLYLRFLTNSYRLNFSDSFSHSHIIFPFPNFWKFLPFLILWAYCLFLSSRRSSLTHFGTRTIPLKYFHISLNFRSNRFNFQNFIINLFSMLLFLRYSLSVAALNIVEQEMALLVFFIGRLVFKTFSWAMLFNFPYL